MYWAVNNILAVVYSIQSVINLQYIPTPSRLLSKWTISTYEKKKYMSQVCNQKNGKYDLTLDLKTCGYISFDILGSNFRPDFRDWRYLRYMDSKVNIKNCCL